ncbi:MAG: hypothetical protein GXP19_04435 [Gammaproteobacteria bacterium]|nr:hypothetical protein [Gammaproteobacteria bacterium]
MSSLELQATPTALWHKLVCDAETTMNIQLEEGLQSYLVFLLMRFTNKPATLSNILALDYLRNQTTNGAVRQEQLRDVGDQCLLFSGLFPGIAARRQVQISYYIDLGKGAYMDLSASLRHSLADIYSQLSASFVPLMDVLQAIRSLDKSITLLDPFQAFELWSDKKSQHAYKTLTATTDAIPASIISEKKH